jgi:hypothetical protein
LGDQIKKDIIHRVCGTYGGKETKPEGRRSLVRPKQRWEDHIKMCLKINGIGVD